MRRWVLDRQAETDLQIQIDYLIERGAIDAAERLSARLATFLRDFLTAYPSTASISTTAAFGRLGCPAPGW